ncbi:hypothetical protein SNE40_018695 [Patella caerulea]|uniref:Tumor susceptibility gene 101 protein n=1 Tax=Patella caerulea TaxID=87958 RepID=A0AAN8P8J3_PATCE
MSNYNDGQLVKALSKYKNPDVTKREVTNVLNQYRDLRPKSEPFVFNNGQQKELLNLEGTIPVSYRGNQYNIPVCIWVLDTHPYNPPMAYVKPTNTMQIKPGKYVDNNGKVDLPFIREWRHPQADLISLVQILAMTFGEDCPVFSRVTPRGGPPPYSSNSGVGAAQPPYPTSGGGMPVPGMAGSSGGNPQYPYPSSTGYPSSGYPNPPYPSSGYPSQSYGGYPQSGGGYPSQNRSYGATPQYTSQYPYNPPYSSQSGYQGSATSSNDMRPGTGTVTEAHIKASLLSAVEDKLKRRLRETFAQAEAEMDVLKKTQTDLSRGKEKLEKMIKDLENEKDECEKNTKLLSDKTSEVKEALKKLENDEPMDMDEAVVTTTPLYRQLLNSFAEEQAIEDTIYYLGEGLRKNVIDLEVFLKQIRQLSRRQFMLRALIQKCREKAGLPPLA